MQIEFSFRETITGIGIPYIGDTNDPNQPIAAITKLRTTVSANGKRCSAFEAFLPATFVKQHGNLKVCFGAVVQRLDIIQQDDICKVQGVFVEDENGKAGTYYVKGRETILCGGAISSPQLLLLRYLKFRVVLILVVLDRRTSLHNSTSQLKSICLGLESIWFVLLHLR